jgi:hypothetical protein
MLIRLLARAATCLRPIHWLVRRSFPHRGAPSRRCGTCANVGEYLRAHTYRCDYHGHEVTDFEDGVWNWALRCWSPFKANDKANRAAR